MILKEWSEKEDPDGYRGIMVDVTPKEAMALIQSLATQLYNGTSNLGRREDFAKDNESLDVYFSISVTNRAEER
jgi:hypothetical protein